MTPKTLIYCTDNSLPEPLIKRCQQLLLKVAGDMPIICISQKPMDFGTERIVMGDLGRSWLSLYKQQDAGLAAAKTPVVAFVEHDCLYTEEHLQWEPPNLETFYYNKNLWLGQLADPRFPTLEGMYSFWPNRTGQSQLIVGRDIAMQAYRERMLLIEQGMLSRAVPAEPGHQKADAIRKLEALAQVVTTEGVAALHSRYLLDWVKKWTAVYFETKLPNIDIRHGGNFSRGKRGWNRTFELPYWGKLKDVLNGV